MNLENYPINSLHPAIVIYRKEAMEGMTTCKHCLLAEKSADQAAREEIIDEVIPKAVELKQLEGDEEDQPTLELSAIPA